MSRRGARYEWLYEAVILIFVLGVFGILAFRGCAT